MATRTATKKETKRTAIVIFTPNKITDAKTIGLSILKKYSFNVSDSVKVGDLIKVNEYSTPIQIVKILPVAFKYYNLATGELSNDYTSTLQWEIKDLIINEDVSPSTVYGKVIK